MFPVNELYGNISPKCPYCNHSQDMGDWRGDDGVIAKYDCEKCKKIFLICTRIEEVYDTVGDCEINNQMPHKLKLRWNFNYARQYLCVNCKMVKRDWELAGGMHENLSQDKYEIIDSEIKGDE